MVSVSLRTSLRGMGHTRDIPSTHNVRRESILAHKIHCVPDPTHERVFACQIGGTHVKMVVVTRPGCSVFAVPHLGLYLGSLPSGPMLLRRGLDFFAVEPLSKSIGCGTTHRVGGLVVFSFKLFGEVILGARIVLLFEGLVNRAICRS